MLTVQPIPRAVIDEWPLEGAGLPARVVHSACAAGIATVGELRAWPDKELLRLHSLGNISLRKIHAFYDLCDAISAGNRGFANIREVFDLFLAEDELTVLSGRYGFERRTRHPSRKSMTLQKLGTRTGRTRERIRQVEAVARESLQSRVAQACLQPFYRHLRDVIRTRQGTVSCAELQQHVDPGVMYDCNACSIALLLSDVDPDQLTFRNGYFSIISVDALAAYERDALAVLENADHPLPLDALIETLPMAAIPSHASRTKCMDTILSHRDDVAVTVDHRCFLYEKGINRFILEVIRHMQHPAHFRTITGQMNEMLRPASRKGAGYVLDILNNHPRCRRVDRGVYDIEPGAD